MDGGLQVTVICSNPPTAGAGHLVGRLVHVGYPNGDSNTISAALAVGYRHREFVSVLGLKIQGGGC